MEFLAGLLEKAASSTVPLIVLLGLLIFVHELGHFLVARFFKVRVETFSLGFGPKILKYKKGDTTYALSAIPLGGYVKMFGDDPSVEVPEEERSGSFLHKPVGQRMAIVLAGPIMNLGFAILLFMMIGLVGDKALGPTVGDVLTDSSAYKFGFRSGDKILSINNEPVQKWEDVRQSLESLAGKNTLVQVARAGSQEKVELNFIAETVKNTNVLSLKKEVGGVNGLDHLSDSPLVGVSDLESMAYKAGLRTGDLIEKVNGVATPTWREFSAQTLKTPAGTPIVYSISRLEKIDNPDSKESKLEIQLVSPGFNSAAIRERIAGEANQENSFNKEGLTAAAELQKLGIENSDVFVLGVAPGSPAEKAGLKTFDRIVSVNETPVSDFDQIVKTVGQYKEGQPPLHFEIKREGKMQSFQIAPVEDKPDKHRGSYDSRFIIGVSRLKSIAPPDAIIYKISNPIEAVKYGAVQSYEWSKGTLISFYKLITAEVSPRNIGSFLSIGKMASQSWEVGVASFLRVMAIISINLFILNLLPIPVLDGGHLIFFSIEAMKGSPLSMKKMEIAQQVGLFLLLGLMAFALFNDFSRALGF